jgi:hypothetical protein
MRKRDQIEITLVRTGTDRKIKCERWEGERERKREREQTANLINYNYHAHVFLLH